MSVYEKRQLGRALVAVSIVQAIVGFAVLWMDGAVGAAIITVAVLMLWLFATLTVTVSDEAVALRFGPGLVRRTIPLADIRAAHVATLPWHSGIGIHWTMNGMLYNVAFGPVAQIELVSGTRVNVGSSEPDALVAAIQDALGHRHSDTLPMPHARGIAWPVLSAVLVAGVALGAAVWVIWGGQRPIAAGVTDGAFIASGAGYTTSLPIGDIASVSIDDKLPRITRRTNGFAAGDKLRGHFSLEGIGAADLDLDAREPPFVTVRGSHGAVLIFNEESPAQTRALFAELQRRVRK